MRLAQRRGIDHMRRHRLDAISHGDAGVAPGPGIGDAVRIAFQGVIETDRIFMVANALLGTGLGEGLCSSGGQYGQRDDFTQCAGLEVGRGHAVSSEFSDLRKLYRDT